MEYSVDMLKRQFDLLEKRGLINKETMACIPEYESYLMRLKDLRNERKQSNKDADFNWISYIDSEIKECKEEYGRAVTDYLEDLCNRISDYKIRMNTFLMGEKAVYTLDRSLDTLLLMRLLNKDLRSCYKVQPADRMSILRPVKYLLAETHGKIILRIDIKSFYESIPFEELMDKLANDGILCTESLYLLQTILGEYGKRTHCKTGIPRGVSCSAFLSEIYMRDVDTYIKALPGVYFYRRYVDDIILFAAKTDGNTAQSLYECISGIMQRFHLSIHRPEEEEKTRLIDTSKQNCFEFVFLGYHISADAGRVRFSIAPSKVETYKERIHEAVDTYIYQSKGKSHRNHVRKPFSQLLTKIRLLTSNYRLCGTKSNVMTGIYFKYPLLTDLYQLRDLDNYFFSEVDRITADALPQSIGRFPNGLVAAPAYIEKIKRRCKKYSFMTGYTERRIVKITSAQMNGLYNK